MSQVTQILGPIDLFLSKIFNSLKNDNIDVTLCELDHVCYRVETDERYKKLKTDLFEYGDLLSEVLISGRLIATFQLHDAIVSQGRRISCLELPAPKVGSPYPEWYEHVEFVVRNLDEFVQDHPRVTFDVSAINKPVNRDVSRKYDGACVKFHEHSLEYVVKYLQG